MICNQKAGANLPDPSSPEYDIVLVQYLYYSAEYYAINKKPDSVLHFAQALNEANQRRKTYTSQAGPLLYSGIAYELEGDQNLAENFYRKANVVMDSSHLYPGILRAKEYFTSFLLRTNQIREAKNHAHELLMLGRQINNDEFKAVGARLLRQIYDNQNISDSGNYYFRMESAIKDSIFSQDNINKLQALEFGEQLRIMDEASKKAAEEEQRKENIQYALITLGIITLIIFYLLLSRSFITNTKAIEFFGVIALLIVFEFLNLLLHPFLERITNHSPGFMLLALVCIGALLVPIHHGLEKWAIKKLVEKNKQIRLAAAKRTIEKLESNQTN